MSRLNFGGRTGSRPQGGNATLLSIVAIAESALSDAVHDLRRRRLPSAHIARRLRQLHAQEPVYRTMGLEPYFIPNDLSLCTPTSVLNWSQVDREVDVSSGFSIQAAASKPTTFARPYYLDPLHGVRRCKGLYALGRYRARTEWTWDLSFVGNRRSFHGNATRSCVDDPSITRPLFLDSFSSRWLPLHQNATVKLHLNPVFFFNAALTDDDRARMNSETRYVESIRNSRFVLCPRGGAPNSIRFFETLAVANIPIYIGDRSTRFPLDWLITWDDLVFRISCEEVDSGFWERRLEDLLAVPIREVNARRRQIFSIYHQFLAPERKPVFEALVLLRALELMYAESG
jgi:hypothetical protein